MNANRRQFLQHSAAWIGMPLLTACGTDKVPASGVPGSSYDEHATAEEVTEGLDLKGKIAVVTGCSSGIGFETMRVLALRGAYVLGTSRSLERATDACRRARGVTTPLQLELSDPDSVVACSEALRSLNAPIDMLVCNAGFRGGRNRRELVNGIEKHFAVNHLGHFLLVNRLLDRLFFAWQGRVTVVASRAAYGNIPERGIRFDDLGLSASYSDSRAYAQSKLANVLFSRGLAQRLLGTRITSNALHPGVINTEIDRNVNRIKQIGFGLLATVSGKSIPEGAATSCYVATNPALGSTSGEYFEDCNAITVNNSYLQDDSLADRLWEVSERLLGDYYVTHQRPDGSEFENGLRKQTKEQG